MSRSIILLGGPDSGKTNYIGRLWRALDAGTGALHAAEQPEDINFVLEVADHLFAGSFAPRSEHSDARRDFEVVVAATKNGPRSKVVVTIVALAAIWLFGGYRLLGLLKTQGAARLQEIVKAIAPARFAARVQIADEAGGRYVGIDPSAQTVVVIDQANGIQKTMPLSDVTEWEPLEDPRKNYQRVTVRFRDYGYPSISILVLTRNMERIKAQLRVAIG